ncbi:MAG: CDC48 family AAA ATPase [archaeon]|nr:CDC48 family AAA ATPase [archaeon]MCP8313481.1 CDC48 family AAA ATPase [archaeon]
MSRERKIAIVQLKVAEARQRDVGKGRARLDIDTMGALGVGAGDIIELIGKRSTPAIAWPSDPEDRLHGAVRIDGQTRKNAGVALNDYTSVKMANVKKAKNVTLIPVNIKLSIDKEFSEFVRNRLKGMPVTEGDDISVVILGSPILFNVAKVRPKAIVRIEQDTHLTILQEPLIEKGIPLRVTYEEIGGLREEIIRLREIVELPLRHPEVFQRLGIDPPNGILLYGPPGCGKTLLAKALANESEANFFPISGPEIMNKYYGETEARLREIFKDAKENSPSIIFIDELDAIAPKREETFGDVEKRVVAQLLSLMDGMSERGKVIVMGATNRPESIDPALRRPGRFDREVEIGVPNADSRLEIIQIHTRGMPLASDVNLKKIAYEAHGYSGADLRALCREAALKALRRYLPEINLEGEKIPPEVLERMVVTSQDFQMAGKEIVPTALREFYIEKPSVRWGEIGGLEEVKRIISQNIIRSIKNPEEFQTLGVKPPRGALIYGPPGCGKTLLAMAIASESGANYITVKGPEILSKWVGESEKAIREIFRKAKASAPCVIFFDEIDSIAKPRSYSSEDSGVGERVLSQLLTEMDSSLNISDIFVMGATNRPDLIDMSLLRPGRLDLLIYVPPPDERARLDILHISTSKMPLADDVKLEDIASMTKGFSGADIDALCREAAIIAMERGLDNPKVRKADFDEAIKKVRPSITPEVEEWYGSICKQLKSRSLNIEKSFYH